MLIVGLLLGLLTYWLASRMRRAWRKVVEEQPHPVPSFSEPVPAPAPAPRRTLRPGKIAKPARRPSADRTIVASGRAGQPLVFEYVDAHGEVTERSVTGWVEHPESFTGFCALRQARRTFRKDRVELWISGKEHLDSWW